MYNYYKDCEGVLHIFYNNFSMADISDCDMLNDSQLKDLVNEIINELEED